MSMYGQALRLNVIYGFKVRRWAYYTESRELLLVVLQQESFPFATYAYKYLDLHNFSGSSHR